ncbi:unnamed protein product [Tenebrio molitor]|nr:unnamed protein product [Tenebrio molitor]
MSPKLFFVFLFLYQTVNINFACKTGLSSTINYRLMGADLMEFSSRLGARI